MRIGHIDGSAALGETKLPVNGVAVYGNKTLTLPTEGTVAYSGDATYRLIGLDNNIQYGSAEFKADFAAKKVDGNLKFSQAGNIGISGDIVGNEFSGKKGVYSTEGGFYGDDAKYLGGVYSGRGAQGTYGAEKK
ncbi:transferrin-binding protein-like solute binding protein [Psychrobacter sp. YGAH215]|uniref:transferrin-binding protein-like solute binding protein n=1 Tax=Psychrobacter sp. YGAH215 TaxID=2596826 RepID=UPI001680A422|nr:transferrin-binding protein-like solute binding protein [Psychrobacter sp. YGAH215]